MSRKVIFLCSFFIFTIFTITSAAPRKIGDWEESLDWWAINYNVDAGFASTGVTSGNHSLRLDGGDPLAQQLMSLDMHYFPEEGFIESFLENEIMTMDVTTITSDWLNNPDAELLETSFIFAIWSGDSSGLNSLNYVFPAYTWLPTEGNLTQTLTWNYKDQRDIIAGWSMGPGWISLAIIAVWPSYEPPGYGGVYYLDNVWLTPEPTTIALLALGALTLFRRKKR